jgi:hypothetical protein
MSVKPVGSMVPLDRRVWLLSPDIWLRANLEILRFGLLTFAKKCDIITNWNIQTIVMSRTIAGVFNCPLAWASGKPVWFVQMHYCPLRQGGSRAEPAGGPLE